MKNADSMIMYIYMITALFRVLCCGVDVVDVLYVKWEHTPTSQPNFLSNYYSIIIHFSISCY